MKKHKGTDGNDTRCCLLTWLVKAAEAANGKLSSISLQAAGLDVPLHLLDTPANRRYADALSEAFRAGLAVDRERGYGDDGPAYAIEEQLQKTWLEIFRPGGRVNQ